MGIPVVRGLIDRRILVNFRIDPDVLSGVLPPPFRPKVVRGYGIGGICLIRLKDIRPRFLPGCVGLSSENAAHRIAVEWDTAEGSHQGVYIPRRDTSTRLNALLGGRLFPGVQHRARFEVREGGDSFKVAFESLDGTASVRVEGKVATRLSRDSLFGSIAEGSNFFEAGSLGYSPASRRDEYEGMELRTLSWKVEPLDVSLVKSSFFEDTRRFPPGSVTFDCALLMRGIDHEWHGRDRIQAVAVGAGPCCSDPGSLTRS